jgi:hypothetical protein
MPGAAFLREVSMSKRRRGLTLALGSASLTPGITHGFVCLRDFELTDDQIVSSFKLLELDAASLPIDIHNKCEALGKMLAREGQQARLVRWGNGVECVLYFDQHLQCPRPEQLLRAYKNAFATRAFMSGGTPAAEGQP